ncbi:MAG: kelch repeat-containing protein, partial [Tannerellaceae bacterium]
MKYIYTLCSTLMICWLMTGCLEDPEIPVDIKNAKKPEVATGTVEAFTATTITLSGEVMVENGVPVTDRGFCWELISKPLTVETAQKLASGKGKGTYKATLTGLKADSTYHICAYAMNAKGITLGEERVVTTKKGLGTVETLRPEGVKAATAICGGIIRIAGEGEVLSRGVYLSLSPNPTAKDSTVISTMETDSFTCQLINLKPLTTYYYAAYVTNQFGTFFGQEQQFTTTDGKPRIKIGKGGIRIGFTDADIPATVTTEGDTSVTLRGICWSWGNIEQPTIKNNTIVCGKGGGDFIGHLKQLSAQTQYFVRAYATNKYGTSYSEETSSFFTKSDLPTVTTVPVTGILNGLAIVGGGVLNEGMSKVTAYGICWGTKPKPTIIDGLLLFTTDTASYSGVISNLKGGVTYYVRAFATNEKGIVYDEVNEQKFSTPSIFRDTTPFPGDNRDGSVGFVLNNQAFLLGGDLGPSCTKELYGYNPTESAWRLFQPYQTDLMRMAVCTKDGVAYAMGGLNKDSKIGDQFYVYSGNIWNAMPSLTATNVRSDAVSFVQNDSVYLVGGINSSGVSNEIWRYDLKGTTGWKPVGEFPVAFQKGIALTVDNTVYVGLGETSIGGKRGFWRTSGKSISWEVVPGTLPDKLGVVSTAVAYKKSIYMIDNNGVVWEYKLDEGAWKQRATFTDRRTTYNMFVLNDIIYILSQDYQLHLLLNHNSL